MAAKHAARSLPQRRAPTNVPRKRRRGRTFYRYRRSLAPGAGRVLMLAALTALICWAALRLHHRAIPPPVPTVDQRGHLLLGPVLPTPTLAPLPLTIAGSATIDPARVDGILAAYGSPLRGHGRDLVDLSRRFGIDDAVALAFFVMESRAGTQGEAILTHSFGNLRPMPGEPALDGYRSYHDWMESAREWFKVLRTLYVDTLKLRTVDDVIPVYAPATDSNSPAAMSAGIHQLVRCWRGDASSCPSDPPGVPALVAGTHR
jgi:hypothetical protein